MLIQHSALAFHGSAQTWRLHKRKNTSQQVESISAVLSLLPPRPRYNAIIVNSLTQEDQLSTWSVDLELVNRRWRKTTGWLLSVPLAIVVVPERRAATVRDHAITARPNTWRHTRLQGEKSGSNFCSWIIVNLFRILMLSLGCCFDRIRGGLYKCYWTRSVLWENCLEDGRTSICIGCYASSLRKLDITHILSLILSIYLASKALMLKKLSVFSPLPRGVDQFQGV